MSSQRDRGLNLRLLGEIEPATYSAKATELRDRVARLKLQLDACDRTADGAGDPASKTFELSQRLEEKWLSSGSAEMHQILEMLELNWKLDGVSLVAELRKPFDLMAEGLLLKKDRGDKI